MNDMVKYEPKKHGNHREWLLRQCNTLKDNPTPPPPKKGLGTEFTGLIKSTADLRYWMNVPDWPCHCVRCDKGIMKDVKAYNKGFCDDCIALIEITDTCCICFEIIHSLHTFNEGQTFKALVCSACHQRYSGEASNSHGFKEGGKLGGELRESHWTDNQNDDLCKIYEGDTNV